MIDLPRRRVEEAADREDPAYLNAQSRRRVVTREVTRANVGRKIAPDDPIFALFDAYKEAKAPYDASLLEMARRHGLPIRNMAMILSAIRRRKKAEIDTDLHELPEGGLPI